MAGFLDQMAAGSRERLEAARARESLATLRARCAGLPPVTALRLGGRFDLIAELKLRSPALGALGRAEDGLEARAAAYAAGGAAAVSVLTEPARFDGSLEHLARVAATLAPLDVPAMRKDFLVDPYQLHEARAAGAGGALLIVRMLSRDTLGEMLDCARDLSLFALLEAFDEDDLAIAAELARPDPARAPGAGRPPVLVGVNCRDLQTLEVVPGRFAALAAQLPPGVPRVAESGLDQPADAARVVRDGYDVALVGGALMRAGDPRAAVRAFLAAGRGAGA